MTNKHIELPALDTIVSDAILADRAFAIASLPLPDSHWLYAPREYAEGADVPKELPRPILNHTEHREAVVAAIRYAVRGATMCGKEPDFDPDALVQNAVYALCGPFGGRAALAEKIALATATAQPVPATQQAPQQSGVGNSGFDHNTAADFLNGKTVSDEAMRKFVNASRWAHDDRVSLQAILLSVRNEIAAREAEIALLKTELMDAEVAPPAREAGVQAILARIALEEKSMKKADSDGRFLNAQDHQGNINAYKFCLGVLSAATPAPAVQDVADMFWNHDDPEVFAHDIDEIIQDFGPGEIVKIDRAKRLPTVMVRVLPPKDEDSHVEYEFIDPTSLVRDPI